MVEHIQALEKILPGKLLSGDAVSQRYAVDWSNEQALLPEVVAQPASSQDVSALLGYCNQHALPVVVQGGMTGLSGGATPRSGELALSLEKMSGVVELDRQSMTITVKAGTPLQLVQEAASEAGFQLPLDLGARGSCNIGGNVSTNAGGNQVLSYGMTRALVLGLEAVLADGTIIRSMNKMLKNNAGYDLKQLFIGSEGTLGVVTEVVLRLFPQANSRQTAMCAFNSFNDAITFLQSVQQRLAKVTAFELMWENYVSEILRLCEQVADPFAKRHPFYVLLESEGGNPETDRQAFEQALAGEMESGLLVDAVIAQSQADADALWAIRDSVAELLTVVKHRANFDIGVPISQMQAFVERVQTQFVEEFPSLQACIFGHVADSNLHIIAWTGKPDDVTPVYEMVYQVIAEFGGTVTAEHGVGVMKTQYLPYCRSPEELALMKTLKLAMDPKGILNPGRVVG